MQLFNRLRIITIHRQGKIKFRRKVHLTINENIPRQDSVSFKVIRNGKVIKESNPEEQSAKIPDVGKKTMDEPNKVEVFLDNARKYAPDKEGIELCDQYLKRLRTL